jgi:hypothetical protein
MTDFQWGALVAMIVSASVMWMLGEIRNELRTIASNTDQASRLLADVVFLLHRQNSDSN